MTPKEQLENLRNIDREIDGKIDMVDKMWERLTSIGASRMKEISVTGGKRKTLEDRIAEHADYSEEVNKMVDDLVDSKMKAIRRIECIREEKYRTLLIERYINNKSWNEVKKAMKYDKNYLHSLHNEAIEEYSKVLSKSDSI